MMKKWLGTMAGEQGQGNFFAWLALPESVPAAGASDPAPTQHIVDAYEMIDGSAVDPNNPYKVEIPGWILLFLDQGRVLKDYYIQLKSIIILAKGWDIIFAKTWEKTYLSSLHVFHL